MGNGLGSHGKLGKRHSKSSSNNENLRPQGLLKRNSHSKSSVLLGSRMKEFQSIKLEKLQQSVLGPKNNKKSIRHQLDSGTQRSKEWKAPTIQDLGIKPRWLRPDPDLDLTTHRSKTSLLQPATSRSSLTDAPVVRLGTRWRTISNAKKNPSPNPAKPKAAVKSKVNSVNKAYMKMKRSKDSRRTHSRKTQGSLHQNNSSQSQKQAEVPEKGHGRKASFVSIGQIKLE